MAEDQVAVLTDKNFVQVVSSSDVPVLVDFWAPWCQPCLLLAPILDELAAEYEGKLTFCKLDITKNNTINQAFGIQGVPTLIIFKKGKEIKRIVGAKPKDSLKAEFDAVIQ